MDRLVVIISTLLVLMFTTSQCHGQYLYGVQGIPDRLNVPPPPSSLLRSVPYYGSRGLTYDQRKELADQAFEEARTDSRREFESYQDKINDVFQFIGNYPGRLGTIGNSLATSHSLIQLNHALKYGYDKETLGSILRQLINFPVCANFFDKYLNPGSNEAISTILQNVCQDIFYLVYEPFSTKFLELAGIL